MSAGPTIYRRPTKSLSAKEPSDRDVRLWKKHRNKKNLTTKIPKSKTA